MRLFFVKLVLNNELKIESVLSIAPVINEASEAVMKKIGMRKVKTFEHALLMDYVELKECVLYEIKNKTDILYH